MEPRVLVVSLFAPYSVNFDATPTGPGNTNAVSDRQSARSGSMGRSLVWNGRRSSMHRTPTTPLGRRAEPHSRRRSTFSVNSVKLAPISRENTKSSDGGGNSSTSPHGSASLSPPQSVEGNGACKPASPDDGRFGPKPAHAEANPGPSQLGYTIDEAAGAYTPPPNTLDFTRKQNIDLMREKRDQKSGAGKHNRLLRNILLTSDDARVPPETSAAQSPLANEIATVAQESEQQSLTDGIAGLQVCGESPGTPATALPNASAVDPSTGERFSVEHLNVGNIGLFNAINASLDLFAERVWIGELGVSTDGWSNERKAAVSDKLLDEFETLPVFVTDSEFEGHYARFCKQVSAFDAFQIYASVLRVLMRPDAACHALRCRCRTANAILPHWHGWEKSAYEATLATCEKFADRIVEIYRDGDIIWVNDYHLMLLPKLLRKRLPDARIGFFLHIPFPSSEIFRCLHVRKELLNGMLGADVVGLQTFSYKRHFIQTAKRVLGVEGSPSGLTLEQGHVVVGQYAMGLDPIGVEDKWSNAAVGELIEFLKEKYAGNYLLVGRDKLDHVKGVRQKLLGYECFLEQNPDFATKTVLIQIALTTDEHNELHVQVMDVVNRINSKFGTIEHQPVVFFHKDIPYSHYLALLSTADAMVITSLRDGMNLTSHEYVLCQREKKSPLILSEFVGTYGSLNGGALGVNPMDTQAIAKAIKDALVMSSQEKHDRWNLLHRQVLTNSATSFVSSFISDVEDAHAEAGNRHVPGG
ncbi:Trehalose-6-P synthase/phosphatase complex subunit [Coemansia sp. RSA 1365]|nr:Trehalose-6-P synthase/phosphatase complex subunit [Coemansia sp. RSA 1365]